ncbi:hypothetical protein ANO11243_033110 [Dothideomycetidae sp. 11243]|nr:hypothetical protein ANO11243_033110 [fungal sp. No.11243]
MTPSKLQSGLAARMVLDSLCAHAPTPCIEWAMSRGRLAEQYFRGSAARICIVSIVQRWRDTHSCGLTHRAEYRRASFGLSGQLRCLHREPGPAHSTIF